MRFGSYVFIGVGALIVWSTVSGISREINKPADGGWNPDPIYYSSDITCLSYKPVKKESDELALRWVEAIPAKDARAVALGWCMDHGYDFAHDKPSTLGYRPGATQVSVKEYIAKFKFGVAAEVIEEMKRERQGKTP